MAADFITIQPPSRGRVPGEAFPCYFGKAARTCGSAFANPDGCRRAGRSDDLEVAAVDHELAAGKVGGMVAGQEAHEVGDLLRAPRTAQRDAAQVLDQGAARGSGVQAVFAGHPLDTGPRAAG